MVEITMHCSLFFVNLPLVHAFPCQLFRVADTCEISVQVFEFLEDISSSLTDLAFKELNMLKDLKVRICFAIFSSLQVIVSHAFISLVGIEKRGRRAFIWN